MDLGKLTATVIEEKQLNKLVELIEKNTNVLKQMLNRKISSLAFNNINIMHPEQLNNFIINEIEAVPQLFF